MGFLDKCTASMKVTPATKKNYARLVQRIYTAMGNDGEVKDLKFLDDVESTRKMMRDHFTASTRRTAVGACMALLGKTSPAYDGYRSLLKEFDAMYKNANEDQRLNEKEMAKWQHKDDLEEFIEQTDRKLRDIVRAGIPKGGIQDKDQRKLVYDNLIAVVYAAHPRRAEYGAVKILSEGESPPKDENSVRSDGNKYVLRFVEYKTSGTYGMREITCCAKVSHCIKRSLDLVPRSYLFSKTDNASPMGKNWFQKVVSRVFPEGTNITTLRKMYLSNLYANDTSLSERRKIALDMGHSPYIAQLIYERKGLPPPRRERLKG